MTLPPHKNTDSLASFELGASSAALLSTAIDVWCRLDVLGRVVAVSKLPLSSAQLSEGGWQQRPLRDAELAVFLDSAQGHVSQLSRTDSSLARVLEDLVDVLITRGVIQFTDLPDAARLKLSERRETRASLSQRLKLLPDEGEDGLI